MIRLQCYIMIKSHFMSQEDQRLNNNQAKYEKVSTVTNSFTVLLIQLLTTYSVEMQIFPLVLYLDL